MKGFNKTFVFIYIKTNNLAILKLNIYLISQQIVTYVIFTQTFIYELIFYLLMITVLIDTNQWYHDTHINPGQISITIGSEYD